MSYEGYDRFLCSNGHLWEIDAHITMYDEELQKCPKCKGEEGWSESIDETNGEDDSCFRAPTKLILDSEKTKICEHCETILEAIYLIPDADCVEDES